MHAIFKWYNEREKPEKVKDVLEGKGLRVSRSKTEYKYLILMEGYTERRMKGKERSGDVVGEV